MADLLGTKHEGDIVRVVNVTRDNFSWTNFDGVTKGIKDLDVQHLSNIYYFIKYLAQNIIVIKRLTYLMKK